MRDSLLVRKTIIFLGALALGAGFLPAAHAATNDPRAGEQYGYTQIQTPSAWTKATGQGITIAIIDSGTDLNHEDLHSKIVANCPGSGCHDYGDNDTNPQDDSLLKDGNGVVVKGHGTHVSGLAAAATDNGKGGVGIARDAKILPLKIFPSNPNGSLTAGVANVPQAVNFAVSHGAKVINLSLGDFNVGGVVGPLQTACNSAFDQGSLCVVAAGNSGQDKASGYNHDFNALVVTANDKDGNHVNFGQKADTKWAVSAPGLFNFSTWPTDAGGYKTISGTSMASPQAAGVAALVFSQHPDWSPAQVAERIVSTVNPMGNPSVNGAGRVNAASAVGAPSVAPTDPGTKSHSSGNAYSGSDGASGGSSSSGGRSGSSGSSGGATKGTLPPAGTTDDADFNSIGKGGDASIGTQNASKSSKAAPAKITGHQVAEAFATILLLLTGLSAFSANRRRLRA
jgi:subtilisin family serine protease